MQRPEPSLTLQLASNSNKPIHAKEMELASHKAGGYDAINYTKRNWFEIVTSVILNYVEVVDENKRASYESTILAKKRSIGSLRKRFKKRKFDQGIDSCSSNNCVDHSDDLRVWDWDSSPFVDYCHLSMGKVCEDDRKSSFLDIIHSYGLEDEKIWPMEWD
jgi:hypothetical protein